MECPRSGRARSSVWAQKSSAQFVLGLAVQLGQMQRDVPPFSVVTGHNKVRPHSYYALQRYFNLGEIEVNAIVEEWCKVNDEVCQMPSPESL